MSMTGFMSLWSSSAILLAESQTVIALRMMGMSGFIPQSPDENARMVFEKLTAMGHANEAAGKAMMAGHGPDRVMAAAIAPLSRKVSANRKRLMR